jgi:AraC family ethanolamine operon transcriptional activator
MPHRRVEKLSVENLEDLSQVLEGLETSNVPLGSHPPKGTLLRASLGDVLLSTGQWLGDVRIRGCVRTNRITLGVKLDSESTNFSFRSGQEVLPGDVYALAQGDNIDYRVTGRVSYAYVSLNPDLLLDQGGEDAYRRETAFWERCRWFCPPQPMRVLIAGSVQRMVRQVSQSGWTVPGQALRQLQSDLVEPFLWSFMFDERDLSERHALPSARIVRKVEDWVDGQSPETLQIADICLALRLSRRTLQRAFTETLGMGPARYLTLKRLTAVRTALRQSDRLPTTVTDAALRYGFWELGRFARDYRRVFHESPSETLARSMK